MKVAITARGLTTLLSGCVITPRPEKILAVGYGAMAGNSSQYTMGQQACPCRTVLWFPRVGNTPISASATQNDNVRIAIGELTAPPSAGLALEPDDELFGC